ncbi:MAG: lipoyl(octanoyl) transferase LipB [Pseudomonadota bacterium]
MVEWRISPGLVAYPDALSWMEERVDAIIAGQAEECVWLLEHPALYTAGTSARADDLLDRTRFPVFDARRGGQYTYHGPGQRVVYVLLDLDRRGRDIRRFVTALEEWIIRTLSDFQIRGERRADRIGVWVERPDKAPAPNGTHAEDKIAAIGVRVRKWVTFHGLSINVEPDLEHFSGIVPCGIDGYGVTSLADLGLPIEMADVDAALKARFASVMSSLAPSTI